MFNYKKKKSSVSSMSSSEDSFRQTKKITKLNNKDNIQDKISRSQSSQNHALWHSKLFKDEVSSSSDSNDSDDEGIIDYSNKNRNYSKDEFRGKITLDFEVCREKYKKNKYFDTKKASPSKTSFANIKKGNIFKNGISKDKSCNFDNLNLYPKIILQNSTIPTQKSIPDSKRVSVSNLKVNNHVDKNKELKGHHAMLVCYDFIAVQPTDVSVSLGQRVQVIDMSDTKWWWIRTLKGCEGYIPSNSLVDIPIIPLRKLNRSKSITFEKVHDKVALNDDLKTNYKYTEAKTVKVASIEHVKVDELTEKDVHINKLKEEYREIMNGNDKNCVTAKDVKYPEYKMDCNSTLERLKLERRRSFSGRQKKVRFLEDNSDTKRYSNVCTSIFGEFVECATWC